MFKGQLIEGAVAPVDIALVVDPWHARFGQIGNVRFDSRKLRGGKVAVVFADGAEERLSEHWFLDETPQVFACSRQWENFLKETGKLLPLFREELAELQSLSHTRFEPHRRAAIVTFVKIVKGAVLDAAEPMGG